MADVFLAPGLLAHIRRSIIDGVRIDEMDIRDPSLKEAVIRRYGTAPIRLWAVKDTLKPRWSKVKPGDRVLFYHAGSFRYAGNVVLTYPFAEEPGQIEVGERLAESVWGRDPRNGKTWPYLIFLADARKIDLPLARLNEMTGYKLLAIAGFMRVRPERAEALTNFLEKVTELPPKPPKPPPTHERVVNMVYEIGELVGYKPAKRWRHEGYEFDVVWFRPPRVFPKCVFEVQLRGNIAEALLRLKHAYDLWESQVFLVSTDRQLQAARAKFLVGALHELAESGKLTLAKIDEIESFHEFKRRFE